METTFRHLYETPAAEIVEVKMELALLQSSSNNTSATRNSYGAATTDTWE